MTNTSCLPSPLYWVYGAYGSTLHMCATRSPRFQERYPKITSQYSPDGTKWSTFLPSMLYRLLFAPRVAQFLPLTVCVSVSHRSTHHDYECECYMLSASLPSQFTALSKHSSSRSLRSAPYTPPLMPPPFPALPTPPTPPQPSTPHMCRRVEDDLGECGVYRLVLLKLQSWQFSSFLFRYSK